MTGAVARAQDNAQWWTPEPGPHVVVTIDAHEFTRDRGKTLLTALYYPDADGPYPLILFSHGAGANKDMSPGMMRYWASHGYVVVVPTHQQELGIGNGPGLIRAVREFIQRSRFGGEKWAPRVKELQFLMDAAESGEGWPPHVAARIDASRIGLAGHSFGAYTALLVSGAKLFGAENQVFDYEDERVDAVVVMSGPGRDDFGLTATSFQTLDDPMLLFAGSADPGTPGEGGPMWRAEPYEFAPDGDKYLAFVKGASHVSYVGGFANAAGSRGPLDKLQEVLGIGDKDHKTDQIYAAVQVLCRIFWDAYLRNDQDALKKLRTVEDSGLDFVDLSTK